MKKIIVLSLVSLMGSAFGQFTGGGTTTTTSSSNTTATDTYVHFGYSKITGNLQNLPKGPVTEWFGGPAGLNMSNGFNFGVTMVGTLPHKKVAFVPVVEVANLGIFPLNLKNAFPSNATKSGTPILRFNQFYGFGAEINAVKNLRIVPNLGVGWGIDGGSTKYESETTVLPFVTTQSTSISFMGFYFNFGYGLHLAYKDFAFSLNYVQGKSHFLTFTQKDLSTFSLDGGATFQETETITEYSKQKMPMRYIEFRFLYRMN